MLFSTSGWRIKFGTCASSVSGSTSKLDGQPVAEARLLDFEIFLQELELVLERDFLLAALVERDAKQIAQPRQHLIGGFHVAVHQRRDRVERVEEKVGMQLPLQRLQLRLGKLRVEPRRLERALLRLAVIPSTAE